MNAKLIQVIQTTHSIGQGTQEDPCRIVTSFFDTEGKLLAKADPKDCNGLLDWAETILCNSIPDTSVIPTDWHDARKKWIDRKHNLESQTKGWLGQAWQKE